ncbi:acyloxyacyl hydrolase [Rickettsiella endosymbiont of Miltochrista miniata]|uniref:acyloxyacyl hydrolase n=1 Tax=Rickettsiella endosymbiont of Miltochrista miniata TaxID=3066239 RepID=UPI00313A82A3
MKLLHGFIIKNSLFFFLYASFILISLASESSYATTHGLQISYGAGDPDHLKGYRVAVQQFWPWIGFSKSPVNLTGYWDLSYANWHTYPPLANQPRSISILAVSPLIRLQSRENWLLAAQPYLELGVGASWLSNNHLGHRNLGGQFAFQDLMGLGLRWRKSATAAWSLSYHYLHYSNASLFPPNQGIDVKHLFTLGYEF